MSESYDLGNLDASYEPDFVKRDLERIAGPAAEEPSPQDEPDNLAERRIAGMVRDFRYTGKALPGNLSLPAGGNAPDATILDTIDRVALCSALRLTYVARLAQPKLNAVLLSSAHAIGIEPWRQASPTLQMLGQDLACETSPAYAGLEPGARHLGMIAAGKAMHALESVTCMPPPTRLDRIFEPSVWQELAKAVGTAEPASERAYLTHGLEFLAARADAMIRTARLSANFSVALEEARQEAGLTVADLSKQAGIPINKMRHWLLGETPRKDAEAAVVKLETTLGLPTHSLQNLIYGAPGYRMGDDVLTDQWRRYLKAAGVPLSILPDDWSKLPSEERKGIRRWVTRYIMYGSPFRRYQRAVMRALHESNAELLYKPLPPVAAEQFEKIKAFKSARVPPAGTKRRFQTLEGRRIQRSGGRWREGTTAVLVERDLRRLVGQIAQMGIDTNAIQFGFLINAGAMEDLTKAIARRRCEILVKANAFEKLGVPVPEDGLFYVEGDVRRLISLRGLFHSETGYLHRNKPKIEVLRSATGLTLIDEAFVARAQDEWDDLVAEQYEAIGTYANDLSEEVEALRDPRFGIQPILDLESPLQALIDARDEMELDRPPYLGSPTAAARHDRDHCLVSLTIAACVRRRNIGPLTFKQDENGVDSGHLRRNPGSGAFELHIPKSELKNERSRALGPGDTLIITLDPEDTPLYRSIERWVIGEGCSRSVLHGKDAGDHLFPGQQGGGICDPMVARVLYSFSARYLIRTPWRQSGYVGVLPFGPHAIRDIVATHVLRVTGSLDAAAAAIYDTVETVAKRYAHLAARDIGFRNIINRRVGLRATQDALRDRLLVEAEPLKLGLPVR